MAGMRAPSERPYNRVQPELNSERGAEQHHKDEVGVNSLAARIAAGQGDMYVNPQEPFYGDITDYRDLQSVLDRSIELRESFASLPSAVRRICDHKPANFLKLAETAEGTALLEEAGIVFGVPPEQEPSRSLPSKPENPASDSPSAEPIAPPDGGAQETAST